MSYAVSLESCELLSPATEVEGSGIVTIEVRSEWSNGSGGLNTATYEVLVNGEDITPHTGEYSVGLGPFEDVTDEASNATYIGDGEMDFIQDGENTVEILYDEERYHCGTFTANLSSGGGDSGGDTGGGGTTDPPDDGGGGDSPSVDPIDAVEVTDVTIEKGVNQATVKTTWENNGDGAVAFREMVEVDGRTSYQALTINKGYTGGSTVDIQFDIPAGSARDVEICVEKRNASYV